MISYDNDIKGYLYAMTNDMQDDVMGIMANFHVDNGVKHEDGSLGDIRITLNELRDCLSYILCEGLNDH